VQPAIEKGLKRSADGGSRFISSAAANRAVHALVEALPARPSDRENSSGR